jgi:hypothetical protein
MMIMTDRTFFAWLRELGSDARFCECVSLSDRMVDEQYDLELVVRFVVLRRMQASALTARALRDLGSFLNDAIVDCALSKTFSRTSEAQIFRTTFDVIATALGDEAFRRFDKKASRFAGPFLISAFEAVALGVAAHVNAWKKRKDGGAELRARVQKLWREKKFLNGIGSGVTPAERIRTTVDFGRTFFEP